MLAKIASIASSSACLVACGILRMVACSGTVFLQSGEKERKGINQSAREFEACGGGMMVLLTFRSSFVLFLALAIITLSLTKTQPTGTSPEAKACSA